MKIRFILFLLFIVIPMVCKASGRGYYYTVTKTSKIIVEYQPVETKNSWRTYKKNMRGINPSHTQVNEYINKLHTEIDKDLIKAIFWHESGWNQFFKDGKPLRFGDDIGIGQINIRTARYYDTWRIERAKWDWKYNILFSVKILTDKYDYAYKLKEQNKYTNYSIEDLAIKAYNGVSDSDNYLNDIKETYKYKPWRK